MEQIEIIALFGKAGAGKDYALRHAVTEHPGFYNEIISCTTRPPREGEQYGINYYFLTEEEFLKDIANGNMLEYTKFRGWYYGTRKNELSRDKINVGVFNPTGVRSLLKNPELKVRPAYVQARPSTRLLRQLNREKNPDASEIVRRWGADEDDFANIEFDYDVIWNDDKSPLGEI